MFRAYLTVCLFAIVLLANPHLTYLDNEDIYGVQSSGWSSPFGAIFNIVFWIGLLYFMFKEYFRKLYLKQSKPTRAKAISIIFVLFSAIKDLLLFFMHGARELAPIALVIFIIYGIVQILQK